MRTIAIIGATSAIAEATAERWARRGGRFFLVARDGEKLTQVAANLRALGAAECVEHRADLADIGGHAALVQTIGDTLGEINLVLIAHGTLPDQDRCEAEPDYALEHFNLNATSVISLMNRLAPLFARQRHGTLAVISSVAGDRGRASNYLYGAAKAAVSAYAEGLQVRLDREGVRVLCIKPGPVRTPMTQGMDLPKRLTAEPGRVADDIDTAVMRRHFYLYTPWYWRPIMAVIRAIPTQIFKRLKL